MASSSPASSVSETSSSRMHRPRRSRESLRQLADIQQHTLLLSQDHGRVLPNGQHRRQPTAGRGQERRQANCQGYFRRSQQPDSDTASKAPPPSSRAMRPMPAQQPASEPERAAQQTDQDRLGKQQEQDLPPAHADGAQDGDLAAAARARCRDQQSDPHHGGHHHQRHEDRGERFPLLPQLAALGFFASRSRLRLLRPLCSAPRREPKLASRARSPACWARFARFPAAPSAGSQRRTGTPGRESR